MSRSHRALLHASAALLGLAATIATSGCAFQNVPLDMRENLTTGLRGGDGRRVIVVVPFADERSDRQRCGMMKNSYNMATAKAVCQQEPATWLAGLLKQELRSAGFQVLEDTEARDPSVVRIKGDLIQLFVEPVIGFTSVDVEADLHLRLVVRSQSGLSAERTFYVKGSDGGLAGTHQHFQAAFDEMAERALKEMVAAIISLMNRFPELGALEAAIVGEAA